MIRPITPTTSTKQSNSISGEPVVVAQRPGGKELRVTPVTTYGHPGYAIGVYHGDKSVWIHEHEVEPLRDELNRILGEDQGQDEDHSQEPDPAVKPTVYRMFLEAIQDGATSAATVAQLVYPGQRNGSNNVRALVSKARKSGHLHEGNPLRLTADGAATLYLLPTDGSQCDRLTPAP